MKIQLAILALIVSLAPPVYADILIDSCDSLEVGDTCTLDDGTAGECSKTLICSKVEEDDDGCATSRGASSVFTVFAGLILVFASRFRR